MVIVGEDAILKIGLKQQSDVLGKWGVIKVCLWYSKSVRLAFLNFKAAFDSRHRGLLNALRTDGVPRRSVGLLDDMNQRATFRIPNGCTKPFEVVSGVRQGTVARDFPFDLPIDDVMRGTVEQCSADIMLPPDRRPVHRRCYISEREDSICCQYVVTL
ncbi:hypothetical protein RB195_021823 [Necator americanus]|uniref:Reverse transcriptase domain-containing protein n=1 Tax=Necator americanus TaxID=51031 RepID=A0ABR1EDT6_NECAM